MTAESSKMVVKFPKKSTKRQEKCQISNELLDLRTWKLLEAIDELQATVEQNTKHINFLIKELGKRISEEEKEALKTSSFLNYK